MQVEDGNIFKDKVTRKDEGPKFVCQGVSSNKPALTFS